MWLAFGKIAALCVLASLHVQTHDILLQLGCLRAVKGTQSSQVFCPTWWTPIFTWKPNSFVRVHLVRKPGWITGLG